MTNSDTGPTREARFRCRWPRCPEGFEDRNELDAHSRAHWEAEEAENGWRRPFTY